MHELQPIETSLAREPATIQDLLAGLEPQGFLQQVSTRDNAAAAQDVTDVRDRISEQLMTGGVTSLPGGNGWHVMAYDGWWVLVGLIYPGREHGRVAWDSPVVLLHRANRTVTYGPEVPALGQLVLGNTFAYEAVVNVGEGKPV